MNLLNTKDFPGNLDFLGGFLNDVTVTNYSDDKIRLEYKLAPNIFAVIKGSDFEYQNGGLAGGKFKSIKVFMVENDDDHDDDDDDDDQDDEDCDVNYRGRDRDDDHDDDDGGDVELLFQATVSGKGSANIKDVLAGKVGVQLKIGDDVSDLIEDGLPSEFSWLTSMLDGLLEGDDGDDDIHGDEQDNDIDGNDGDDDLSGGRGDDKLHGGKGDDDISGGGNNDKLWGGKGNDVLWGNKGRDKFVFAENFDKDKIKDFKDDVDTILLDSDLWKGNKSIKQILNKFGEETANGVVLDFGGGDILKIDGVDSLKDLRNDIDII